MNAQTTAAEKFFGVDTEMRSLKAKVEQKDSEIAKEKLTENETDTRREVATR